MADLPQAHLKGLKVAVTGASGNVGTALLRRLTAPGSGVAEVRGLARRRPPGVAPPGPGGSAGPARLGRLPAPGGGVAEVRGLARRRPPDVEPYSSVTWYPADLGETSRGQAAAEPPQGAA